MSFITYENRSDPHTTIHRDNCTHLYKHGGTHKYGQGKYEKHTTYAEARAYAKTTGFKVNDCLRCKPQDVPKAK